MNSWHVKYRPLACCKRSEYVVCSLSIRDKAARHILINLTKGWDNPSGSYSIWMNFSRWCLLYLKAWLISCQFYIHVTPWPKWSYHALHQQEVRFHLLEESKIAGAKGWGKPFKCRTTGKHMEEKTGMTKGAVITLPLPVLRRWASNPSWTSRLPVQLKQSSGHGREPCTLSILTTIIAIISVLSSEWCLRKGWIRSM